MYYYNARYYNASLGRFISPDSIIPDPTDPQAFNRYSYTLNNPVKYVDPTGNFTMVFSTSSNYAYGYSYGYAGSDDRYDGPPTHHHKKNKKSSSPSSSSSKSKKSSTKTAKPKPALVASTPYMNISDSYGGQTSAQYNADNSESSSFSVISLFESVNSFLNRWVPGASSLRVSIDSFNNDNYCQSAIFCVSAIGEGALTVFSGGESALATPVKAYQVGLFSWLKKFSLVGDDLAIHHVGQAHVMRQLIPGFKRGNAPAIVLPTAEHLEIPTIRGVWNGTARELLARDIWHLRRYSSAPNSALQKLIQLNKELHPESFLK